MNTFSDPMIIYSDTQEKVGVKIQPSTAQRCRSEKEKIFWGLFQFSIVIVKKISPLWKSEI